MAQLYLIRHARSQMMGDAAWRWDLSQRGRREASTLARQDFWRHVDRILSSPELKAQQTAEPAARRWDIPLETVDCLHELRRPRLVKDYPATIARVFAEPECTIAGLETASHAADRVQHCIQDLATAHPHQTLAVVSHGLLLVLFLARLQNRWPTTKEWQAVPFAGVAVLDTNTWQIVENWSRFSRPSKIG
ncbi:MAG TPA: histidine phosphatase family protein [Chloroflexi bacterium]|nr:histidine phosphatase family protein [Chloroflexota bacterium]